MKEASRKPFVPLSTRLTVPVVLLVVLASIGAYFGVARTSRMTAMRSREDAAAMVVELTSLSVMPAVVFADDVEMTRAVEDLAKNTEVTDVEIWSTASAEAPQKLLASVHRPGGAPLPPPARTERELVREDASVRVMAPIVSPEHKVVAMLTARFSTTREAEALKRLSQQVLYAATGIAVCLVLALLLVLRSVVVKPIQKLQQAAQSLARGELGSVGLDSAGASRFEDEVGRLADAFGDMAGAVRDREERLGLRNSELRLILDSVQQGFLTARRDGTLLSERSAILHTWLGQLPDGITIWELIGLIEPQTQAWTEMAWSQVIDNVLPLDVALDQLPRRLTKEGLHFDVEYHPVLQGSDVERVVIVLSDVTAEVERQRALAEQHEFSILVDQFIRDRRAFHDFWNEANELVDRIVSEATPAGDALRRDVHTLKGNARFFGLTRLAEACHAIEDGMQDRGELALSDKDRAAVTRIWEALRRRVGLLMAGATSFIEISREEYERLGGLIRARVPHADLEVALTGLRLEPVEWRLGRAKQTLVAACAKLGKSEPRVVVEHNDVRTPPGRYAPFWSVLGHVLNNAADHGVEPDEERRAARKSLPATVRLGARMNRDLFVIEVSDDGRGIDWKRVQHLAEQKGLPASTQTELETALMSDGFTLRDSVSEVSGRGVGLAAVRSVVVACGGRIEIQSQLGRGTTWRFVLPAVNEVAASGAAARHLAPSTPSISTREEQT